MSKLAYYGRELPKHFQRYAIGVQYYGPAFSGWNFGDNEIAMRPSIPKMLDKAFNRFVGSDNFANFCTSSRTDSGVHAIRNVIQVDLLRRERQRGAIIEAGHTEEEIRKALNFFLNHDRILVTDVERKAADYDARGFSTGRTYTYRILTRKGEFGNRKDSSHAMFHKDFAWVLPESMSLDIDSMKIAAHMLLGEHDFSSYRAAGCQSRSTRRELTQIDIILEDPQLIQNNLLMKPNFQFLTITITANAFLRKMIRNIVSSLVLVGNRSLSVPTFAEIFHSKLKFNIRPAPPEGLYLVDVHYEQGKTTSFQRAELCLRKKGLDFHGEYDE